MSIECDNQAQFSARETVNKGVKELVYHIFSKGVEVQGVENLPNPPYIAAFNHMGWLEAVVLALYLPHSPCFITKEEAFKIWPLGPVLKNLGFFPVRRGTVDRQAIRKATSLLQEGNVLAISPEGTRGRSEEREILKPAKTGIIYIAKRTGKDIPIVPIAIWGTEGILPLIEENIPLSQRFSFKRAAIQVRIGQPYEEHYSLPAERITSEQMKPLADGLMLRIRDLLPEEYHGYYKNIESIDEL